MSWNYRVVHRSGEFAIYSAYYDDDGRCRSISVEPAQLNGDSIDELRTELELFRIALEKPVLNYTDFDKK